MTQSHSGLNNIVYFFHAQKSRIMKPRVGMVALFHFEVIDSYCLVIQSCIVSVCRITSWSKMAAPIPIFVITFQPAKCRKGGKGHVKEGFQKFVTWLFPIHLNLVMWPQLDAGRHGRELIGLQGKEKWRSYIEKLEASLHPFKKSHLGLKLPRVGL